MSTPRLAQVAAPVPPSAAAAYEAYLQRCLATWTVDVVLTTGEYYAACPILVPQGNSREGFRRLFKVPRAVDKEDYWLGDQVVVAFLDGSPEAPVVLGALYIPERDAEGSFLPAPGAPATPDEWRDRHEVLTALDATTVRPAYTDRRDSAVSVREEHVVWSGTDNVEARVVADDVGARTLTREHRVETGPAETRVVDAVRSWDEAAQTLQWQHTRQEAADQTHVLTIEDLHARVLQLQQVVEVQAAVLHKLTLRSDDATKVTLHHETPDHTLTLVSDGDTQHMGLVKTVPGQHSSSLTMEADGTVVLRRGDDGQPDSWLVLDADGSIVLHAATGASVRLADGVASVRSGGASVVVEDTQISVLTADGGVLTLTGADCMVAAGQVTLNAPDVTIRTGAMRVGETGTFSIPATQRLYPKLRNIEERVDQLETLMRTHRHNGNNVPATAIPMANGAGQFVEGEYLPDSLQSLKGD